MAPFVAPGEGRPRRIGLFGGTFDPVHFGHLRPALELATGFDIDALYLLPNHRPGHRDAPAAATVHRIAMLERAIEGCPHLKIDAREALRERATYTIDSLRELAAEEPRAQRVFFMGEDAFEHFESWHDWEEILTLANLVIIERPGHVLGAGARALLARQRERAGAQLAGRGGADLRLAGVIERVSVTQLEISATRIRSLVATGQSVQFLVPESVREYIAGYNLYRQGHPPGGENR